MSRHKEFILKPISDILKEVVNASSGIDTGIETYPLYDYILQATFLKMTGNQEQKMKCICWEMATNDYEYRRVLLANDDKLGECSKYDEKSKIYKRLIEQICKYVSDFNVTNIDKKKIRKESDVKELFTNTNLFIWGQGAFNKYENLWKGIENKHFANENNSLFPEIKSGISLKKVYDDYLYKHRNRIAHNTLSYQQNLPTLKTLIQED